jgi:hypothetical protein
MGQIGSGLTCALLCCVLLSHVSAQDFWLISRAIPGTTGFAARGQEPAGDDPAEISDDPFAEHIETDRDSFTPATTTAGLGRWIVESAYSFIDNRRAPDTHSFPELVVRYGLTDRFEVRLGWNYEAGGGGNVVSSVEGDEGLEGPVFQTESRTLYGFKLRTTDQSGWIPESSLLVEAFTPTTGDTMATEASVTYVWGWELPDRWKLDAAIRYATASEKEDDFAIWNPSTVLRVPLNERWTAHAEYFGSIPQGFAGGRAQHFFSPGLHYLMTPDLEVGFRVGWGLNDASARFFVNAGVGLRY